MIFFTIAFILLISVYVYNCVYYSQIVNQFYNELNILKKNYITYSSIAKLERDFAKTYHKCRLLITINISKFKNDYRDIYNICREYNDIYVKNELIKKKKYFDKLFKYPLDEEQRKAIVVDDDNNLIVAGAGSGKTTTIIGKTKYLIEKKLVDPKTIITISFTNATADNFRKMLDNSDVRCSTFHKLGKDILDEGELKSDVADENFFNKCFKEYFSKEIYKDNKTAEYYVRFCAYYMHVPPKEDTSFGDMIDYQYGYDLETLKSKCKKSNKLTTLNKEEVKSLQELLIANYLFLHGIEYEYEPKYKYETATVNHRQYHPDFYLPSYDVYIEHFGINEEGKTPQFSLIEEKKYLDGIEYKRNLHNEYHTNLIETYSYEFFDNNFESTFESKLKSFNIIPKMIPLKNVLQTFNELRNNEMTSFQSLVNKFIKMFKGNNFDYDKFKEFISDAKRNENNREVCLLNVISKVYLYYQNMLKKNKYIDFDDMINLATLKVKNHFDWDVSYIIIDEFQDVSFSRYSLIKAIKDKTDAKVIAVGDDWQSIFRFSGCDLDLFINFKKYFSHPQIMYISNTYRNCQNLIDVAGEFIMQNSNGQIKKSLVSNKDNIDYPIEYIFYKKEFIAASKTAVQKLLDIGCKKIAILGRNNSDIRKFEIDSPKDLSKILGQDVEFTTVHKSKGLEYDGTIIINMSNFIAGFPNKMSDDPILEYVTRSKEDYLYEEERRLFYVALTRTKTKCILLVPIVNPSCFAEELFQLSNQTIPKFVLENDERLHNPNCPKCKKGILVTRRDPSGQNFVGCTNYPICDFKYKDIDILTNHMECPKCGGYLVRRSGSRGLFYGCTNYPFCTQTADGLEYLNYNNDNIDEPFIVNSDFAKWFKNDSDDDNMLDDDSSFVDDNNFCAIIDNCTKTYEFYGQKERLFVDIQFDGYGRVYSYLCESDFPAKINDEIKYINQDGRVQYLVVRSNPYFSSKTDYVYKVLNIK